MRPAPGVARQHAAGFRPDVEGLRAFAVVPVVLDHAGLGVRGGFIGVDVFFVISGFLITGLLVGEGSRTGRVSYARFYARRARRILPVSTVVLVASWFAADHFFRGARVRQTHEDIAWAAGFSANWHFASLGTDYFQVGRPVSPVQHFWSLAVEEQFYVVWPLVIIAVLALGRWRTGRGDVGPLRPAAAQLTLLAVFGALAVASFGYGLHDTATRPAAAYFDTGTRAWELGAGALLAITIARWPALWQRTPSLRGPLQAAGLIGIVVCAFVTPSSGGFPTPGAAWGVLFSVLVLGAGAGGGTGRWSAPLTNPLARYVGRISYSIYLWHFPVIVFTGAAITTDAGLARAVEVLATLGLSMLSFHFIESPFRRALPRVRRGAGWIRDTFGSTQVRLRTYSTFAGLCLLASFGLYGLRPGPPRPPSAAVIAGSAVRDGDDASEAPASASLRHQLDAALSTTRWPFPPTVIDDLGTTEQSDWAPCNVEAAVLASCTYGSGSKTAVVIGDSIALAELPAVRAALVPAGWRVVGLAKQQCPAAHVSADVIGTTNQGSAACDAHQAWVPQAVRQLDPQLVVLTTVDDVVDRLASGARGADAEREYEQGQERTLRELAAPGRRLVTLSPPPGTSKPITSCDTPGSSPTECISTIPTIWEAQRVQDRAAAAATGTTYLDTHLWFCSAGGLCPDFAGSTPIYYDTLHPTPVFAELFGPSLRAALGVG